jgi:branched-subunit amino acid aminotransferase/4-amino-4-deoxychorismate lyase
MDEPQAYLNGHFLPASRLAISPTDAGFVLGAAVAEQLRTFQGKIFRLGDHLARLEHSLEIVGVDPGLGRSRMAEVAEELVARNHRLLERGDDLGLSIFVTPGTYVAYTSGHEPPSPPTVCLHTYPLPFRLWAEKYRTGQSLWITRIEQVPPTSWPAGLKCRSRMHYYLADQAAAAAEPQSRALLLDSQGRVTETATANVAIYTSKQGLISPPQSQVLEGISLAQLWQLAAGLGIPTVRRELVPDEVAAADEVLLTSTPLCLLPVVRLDGQPIGHGRPGEVFGRLLAAWSHLVGLDVAAQAARFADR